MAEHMMMPMTHGSSGGGLRGYRMGMNDPSPHRPQPDLRTLPSGQVMHYARGPQSSMEAAMRQRNAMNSVMNGHINGQMGGGHSHQMQQPSMMYGGPQQQGHPQAQHHHMHLQNQHAQQYVAEGDLTSQQLMASMHLQKLNTQYHGHPHGPVNGHHMGNVQHRMGSVQLVGIQVGPSLGLNIMDIDLIDEEVLTSLVLELGLDRVQELPELFLGQNEFDFFLRLCMQTAAKYCQLLKVTLGYQENA